MTRTTSASPETVFDKLTDHAAYSEFTPLRSSSLIKQGSPEPNGVGAQRKLGLVGPPLVEEVLVYERPTRFAYTIVKGLPVRDQRGEVTLTAVGDPGSPDGGTRIDYHVTAHAAVPGVLRVVAEPVLDLVLKTAIKGLLDGVVKASERS